MSLVVNNLYKKYGEKVVVDDISFKMEKPGVYALMSLYKGNKVTLGKALKMMIKN